MPRSENVPVAVPVVKAPRSGLAPSSKLQAQSYIEVQIVAIKLRGRHEGRRSNTAANAQSRPNPVVSYTAEGDSEGTFK